MSAETAFRREAAEILAALQHAFVRLGEVVPGGVRKSRDLQQALGINIKLSWQAMKIVDADSPLAVGPFVPSPTSFAGLIRAARKGAISSQVLQTLVGAYERYRQFVEQHAGDRDSFDSMLRGVTSATADSAQSSDTIELQHRRNMFKGASHYWGCQAGMIFNCAIIRAAPEAPGSRYERIILTGKLALRRLRTNARLHIGGRRARGPAGWNDAVTIVPIDAVAAAKYGASVLPDFSTRPIPQFRTIEQANGWQRIEAVNTTLGERGAVNLVFADLISYDAGHQQRATDRHNFLSAIQTPCLTLCHDLLLERRSYPNPSPSVRILGGSPQTEMINDLSQFAEIPLAAAVQSLGAGIERLRTTEIPGYADMLTQILERRGWSPVDFDAYRVLVRYPLMHTTVDVEFSPE